MPDEKPAGDRTPRAWVVSVWRGGGENLDIARRLGVWGAKDAARLASIEPGDRLLFVYRLGFRPGTKSSRAPLDQYLRIADRAAMVIEGVAESGLYEDTAPVWPDDVYPHRIRWRETGAREDVPVVEQYAVEVIDALRQSMIMAGRAYSVDPTLLPPSPPAASPPRSAAVVRERIGRPAWGDRPKISDAAPPAEHRAQPFAPTESPQPADAETDPSGAGDPGHTRAQLQLAEMGRALRLEVWVPRADRNKTHQGQRLGDLSIDPLPPLGFTPAVLTIVQNIDVLWLHRGVVTCAFEVEHSTSVFSGILRMSDLVVEQPYTPIKLFIVAAERRRDKVRRELARPTFAQTNLGAKCRFLSYERLEDRLAFVREHGGIISTPEWLERLGEPTTV